MQTSRLHILLADNNEIYRYGLKLLLEEAGFAVTATASDSQALLSVAKHMPPDILLINTDIRDSSILKTISQVRDFSIFTGIIAICSSHEKLCIAKAEDAGAHAVLSASCEKKELLDTIDNVRMRIQSRENGPSILKPAANHIRQRLYTTDQKQLLSPKEIEIIRMICQGFSTKEIGHALSQGARTVDGYRRIILKKIEARNPVDIVMYAIRNGLHQV
ncbi:response regulator transcription factor [Sediminibacterium ginsengisoli]|uniref:DNA-binding response regulator, NarL/FixJ family, contains REC and HTH domains n=1 Tax=Sediminibacterium ginsengisoli TaxID=413434 RepID=A0A1T4KBY1_9BACT|nr:response regulator transcription factor [Sediminibacterium ginsengisoli]SJZ39825.1 DNA-binding response regulator, NarL/FixJ family, contains REC and HTH domains [Sediminibacterium ginsengisoli]